MKKKSASASTDPKKHASPKGAKRTKDSSRRSPSRKKLKDESGQCKITKYFDKADNARKALKEANTKSLDIKITSKATSSKKLPRSYSSEKYGRNLPSFDKILEDRRDLENFESLVKEFEASNREIVREPFTLSLPENKPPLEVFHCKDLPEDDIVAQFKAHKRKMSHIMKGKLQSRRHNEFYRLDKTLSLEADLSYAPSLMVFTQQQLDQLMDLLQNKFDPDNKKLTYVFKVLLPELCLLIFMDVHEMDRDKAESYLQECPLV